MRCPHFEIIKIGVYDSMGRKGAVGDIKERLVSSYEFEFYTTDCPGGRSSEGVLYPARKNGCTLFKPGQKQRMIVPYKCYYMNLVTQDPELCHLLDHLSVFFVLTDMDEVMALFHRILAVESRDTLAGRMEIQSCVCKILGSLEKYGHPPRTSERNVLRHQQTLMMADQYIRDHVSEDLSLAMLAKLCNLDPTYFHKLYTAAFGRTPAQQVLSQRILAAKKDLLITDLPLEEIAARCGFSSQTYFCYQFKRVVGKTPGQYRVFMRSR